MILCPGARTTQSPCLSSARTSGRSRHSYRSTDSEQTSKLGHRKVALPGEGIGKKSYIHHIDFPLWHSRTSMFWHFLCFTLQSDPQTRNSGNKDTNYMLAILDSRMRFVAHERFQYVLLKKFGKFNIWRVPEKVFKWKRRRNKKII